MKRRQFSLAALAALGSLGLDGRRRVWGAPDASTGAAPSLASSIDRIKHWVVVMFENRSFDSVLGWLAHIPEEDGLRGREVLLPYPGGQVRIHPTRNFSDPIPDPGEAHPNVNVQMFGSYNPASNAGKAGYPIFPDVMAAPFNAAPDGAKPTMDGFALDYYWNSRWQLGRTLSDEEMQSLGGVFTPETAPVINTLAREYAVFTRWFCDVPTCTFPNRTFFHAGTSDGRIDNALTYDYAWDNDLPNLFTRCSDKGVSWKCYFYEDEIVPVTAINLAGLRHLRLWTEHAAPMPRFLEDCRQGTLPSYAWVEPRMMFGETEDYHPPSDVRAAERFLALVYDAVRRSPQWEETALVVMFDEHGGCYDHVAPPVATPPGDGKHAEGFAFDHFGVRVPAIVISPWTARGTVVRDTMSNTSMTHTLQQRLGLGAPLTARVAAARTVEAAFNLDAPRTDNVDVRPLPYVPGRANPEAQQPVQGDLPGVGTLEQKWTASAEGTALRFEDRISELGEATFRNVGRFLRLSGTDFLPRTAPAARAWLAAHFVRDGRVVIPDGTAK